MKPLFGITLSLVVFAAPASAVEIKLFKKQTGSLDIQNYQQCSLPDLLAVSPLGEKFKNRSSVRYTALVSNFASVSRCSGSQCSLSLSVGAENTENIEYFEKNDAGQCAKVIENRQNVSVKTQYFADISGSSEELVKQGIFANVEDKLSIERKTETGRYGGGLSRTVDGKKVHHITVQYGELKPTKDTIKSETTGGTLEVNYEGINTLDRTKRARTKW